jgi:hypothetical protein
MRATQERTIDGKDWTVTCFPVSEGLKLLVRLGKLIGGPLGKAVSGMTGESLLEGELDMAALGDAVTELATKMDEDDVLSLVKRLFACTMVVRDGKRHEIQNVFDTEFVGCYTTMFKVLGFVIEVNYSVPLADLFQHLPIMGGAGGSDREVS